MIKTSLHSLDKNVIESFCMHLSKSKKLRSLSTSPVVHDPITYLKFGEEVLHILFLRLERQIAHIGGEGRFPRNPIITDIGTASRSWSRGQHDLGTGFGRRISTVHLVHFIGPRANGSNGDHGHVIVDRLGSIRQERVQVDGFTLAFLAFLS